MKVGTIARKIYVIYLILSKNSDFQEIAKLSQTLSGVVISLSIGILQ